MGGAEMALQEFIDALQTLILLLPQDQRLPVGSTDEPLGAAAAAARRTLQTAKQLRARLVALRENPSS